jgi:class 3 adenylate cyclase
MSSGAADHTRLDRATVSTDPPTPEDEAPIQDHTAVAATPTWAPGADEGSDSPLPLDAKERHTVHALDQEHKQVTILCCVFAEAASLAARLDAKAMHHLMQAFFARAQASVERYGGGIIHYGGDDFTALFGAPVAYEDHARWAVLAALDPRKAQGQMWQRRRRVFAKAWTSCAIRVQNRWSCVPRGA